MGTVPAGARHDLTDAQWQLLAPRRGIRAAIPIKRDQQANRLKRGPRGGRPPRFDPEVYRQRHAVEGSINLHKQKRGVATRYDRLALRSKPPPRSQASTSGSADW